MSCPFSQAPRPIGPGELTYDSYLRVPELLQLQSCLSDPQHHDEMLFIVIHQAYELWFKMIHHELANAMRCMEGGLVLRAHHFLKRVVEIQKLLVGQIHLLETMAPIEFLGFRGHINPASGFQSTQFRELEFVAGLKDPRYLSLIPDEDARARLQAKLEAPDLWMAFQAMLKKVGFDLGEARPAHVGEANEAEDERTMKALISIYGDPAKRLDVYLVAESLVDFDTQLSLWRTHHVTVVERVIGFKSGTGGSSGASYLRSTLGKKAFPALWAVRGRLDEHGHTFGPEAYLPGGPFHVPSPEGPSAGAQA